ncbi:SET domain containing protein [Akanthomyces lecanii RCEF 1005]|uniref:SET domain containing protein n=1 Tax=Akanthomyces lecanii RCEF 1005 TaxID=1081108 RepID=A0A167XLW8_CORDF|nr:SET domain containing protein [Akanthomyces lecanii RCEF 1005]
MAQERSTMRDSTATNIGASGALRSADLTFPSYDMHRDGPLVLSEIQSSTDRVCRTSPTADQKSTLTPTRPRTGVRVSETCARRDIIYIESSDEGEPLAASKPRPHVGLQPRKPLIQTTQLTTPPSRADRASASQKQWNKTDLTKALLDLLNNVRHDHSRLVTQAIEATTPAEWRVQHGADLFEELEYGAVPHRKGETMRINFMV